jgi:dihydroorotate dehydrogenase electron transfer subunit
MSEGFEQPVMMKIDKIISESDNTKSFMFRHNLDYKPGQFIMVWLPGIDEKPFAVSYSGDDFFGITVLERGKFTKHMHSMGVGEQLGIRGPFGHGFSMDGSGNACVIGGGCGMASLTVLIESLQDNLNQRGDSNKGMQEHHPSSPPSQENIKDYSTTPSSPPYEGGEQGEVTILNGATTKTTLLFKNRYKDITIFTDDGSEGIKGYPTDVLEDLHKKNSYSIIYTCGPEIMMSKVYEFCKKHNIQCEASLERYMKCGIGICGQCVCDGQMVCKDGPVFNLQALNNMSDFGNYSLLKSGQRVSLKEYGEWRGC